MSIRGLMEALPRSGRSRIHTVGLLIPILLASSFGYIVYNAGLGIGAFKPSTVGVIQCAQSFGSIGCPDTINGLFYTIIGGLSIFLLFRYTGYGLARKR